MSLTKSTYDDLHHDLSPVEREYGEGVDDDPYGDGPWPSEQELIEDNNDDDDEREY